MKIGLAILTLNAEQQLKQLIGSLAGQSCYLNRRVVVDSESSDNTIQIAKQYGFEIMTIKRSMFNHGGVRGCVADYLEDMDIVIFMTQDAILYDADSIKRLVSYFADECVGAAYGRQLPHIDASPLASHARLFNYNDEVLIKSYADKAKLGIKTPFMSDSYAAYRISALGKVGGFPERVIIGEDMYVGAKLLKEGYKLAYAADSKVYHSHDYTLIQEFRRYFDTGVFQSEQPWIREEFGAAEGEGLKFVKNQLKYLQNFGTYSLIAKSVFLNAMKLFGYRLGIYHKYLPRTIKKFCSGQSYYFK